MKLRFRTASTSRRTPLRPDKCSAYNSSRGISDRRNVTRRRDQKASPTKIKSSYLALAGQSATTDLSTRHLAYQKMSRLAWRPARELGRPSPEKESVAGNRGP